MNHEQALERMPHKRAMRLIRRIVSADRAGIHCLAKSHAAPDYPLRLDGVLFAVTLAELGAQAGAAHASLFEIGKHHTGLLVGLRGLEAPDPQIPPGGGGEFEIFARQLHFSGDGAIYRFRVCDGARVRLSGQVTLKIREAGA